MNDMEIGILVLGVLIVLGVVAYNKWQESLHQKNVEKGFHQPGDVLLEERREPFARPDSGEEEEEEYPKDEADETLPGEPEPPRAAEGPLSQPPDERPRPAAEFPAQFAPLASFPDNPLSSTIDLIVELSSDMPIDLSVLRMECSEVLLPFGKRLNWSGWNEAENVWVFHAADADHAGKEKYRRLCAGLQLVNRKGAVELEEIEVFLQILPRIAERFQARCHVPSIPPAEWHEQARQLDAFCSGLDIVLYLSLVSNERPFPGTKIRAKAEAESMILEHGIYVLRDENGTPLFRLWNTDEANPFTADGMKHLYTSDLTFQFDVPCIPRGAQVFLQMLSVIRSFAKVLNGTLIDDQNQPLSEETLEQIRQDYVIRPQSQMAEEGIPAGSMLARRLFS